MRMHDDEVDIDGGLVRALVAAQFPRWANLPVAAVASTGTVNAIFRLGADLYVRLPRHARWRGDLDKELRWLPALAPQLPLRIPEPVAAGTPGLGYPFRWAIYRWIEGQTYARDRVAHEMGAAAELAGFVTHLRRVDPAGAPVSTRDRPLATRDEEARTAIASLPGTFDAGAVTVAWERALSAPAHEGPTVWTHGDLLPPNVLVQPGSRLALLDFGSAGVGDPAIDVIPAWTMFESEARHVFRDALAVDDATWDRARGLALHQALLIVPYYLESNPGFARMATRTVEAVVADAST